MATKYFSGQGKVYMAELDTNAQPKAFRFVGNVPELKINLATDMLEHKESTSGNRVTDARIVKENKASVNLTIEDFTKENLAMAFWGDSAVVTGATVTDELLPTGLVVGDYARLKYPKVSSVTFKDSTGTPKVPTSSNIGVASANHGLLSILDITTGGPYVQPFKVSYTYGDHTNIRAFKGGLKERWLRFEGLNTADSNTPVLVELYRVLLDPAKDLSLITDDLGKFPMDGSVLFDTTKDLDAQLGGFGRIVLL